MTLYVPRPHLSFIVGHAHGARPAEACGLLGLTEFTPPENGDGPKPSDWITETIYPGDNIADDPTDAYLLNPRDQFRYEREIEKRGQELAVYHSHPRSGAAASQSDLRLAEPHPGRLFLIVGCEPTGDPEMASIVMRGLAVELGVYRAPELERVELHITT